MRGRVGICNPCDDWLKNLANSDDLIVTGYCLQSQCGGWDCGAVETLAGIVVHSAYPVRADGYLPSRVINVRPIRFTRIVAIEASWHASLLAHMPDGVGKFATTDSPLLPPDSLPDWLQGQRCNSFLRQDDLAVAVYREVARRASNCAGQF
jgi:hypothetical protein